MSNANAQVVGYVGSSICNLFKLAPHLEAQGHDVQTVMNTVIGELDGLLGPRGNISPGKHVDIAASFSSPHGGVAQNSGLSIPLA